MTDNIPLTIQDYAYRAPGEKHLPWLAPVRQQFDTTALPDPVSAAAQCVEQHAAHAIKPGMRVAVTAGSRGIANIADILAAVVATLRRLETQPFIVAAMGSHGGATSAGQRAVLAGYGITEEAVGCPILTDMETVSLGHTAEGVGVGIDRVAYQADAIILVNRVKPHSILTGDLGSGLLKMAAIGLGKASGADTLHTCGLERHLLPVARRVLERAPVLMGVAIVENSFDQTWKIEGVPAAEIEAADRRLLTEARALLPTIPFNPIDVLIVDRVGKNFSGTGMDPNVIGMHRRIGGLPERHIGYIVALDLSPESHGNAHGIGMADVITHTLRTRIDWEATYTNGLTAGWLAGGKLPLTCATAADAVALALKPFDREQARVVRIVDTAHLSEVWVSRALLADLPSGVEQVGDLRPLLLE